MDALFTQDEPLSKHTSYGVGGKTRFFVRVSDVGQLPAVMQEARKRRLPFYVLGGGSNTFAREEGFSGLVIKIEDRSCRLEGERMIAAAGVFTASASQMAMKAGLSGLEWAAGIPGTLGGALRGNAEAFGGSFADILEYVEVLNPETLECERMLSGDFEFHYRWSVLAQKRRVILRAVFHLSQSTVQAVTEKTKKLLAKKSSSQPLGVRSAGSVFKNIVTDSLDPRLIPADYKGASLIHAGWLLEKAGLKGYALGGATFSEKHANFILNGGKATSSDICALIELAKQKVKERFGLDLEEEIRTLGDEVHTTY